MIFRTAKATTHPHELLPDFEVARRLHQKHGKSYYFATRFFPPDTRLATWALYAFFRVPDEIVDNEPQDTPEDIARVKEKLAAWQRDWRTAYETRSSEDPVLRVTSYVFHHYKIPFSYSDDFLRAMTTDLEKATYANYAELEDYMYGSAAVVGLMMSHVIGFRDDALQYAEKLGYAMQLTNFLRDIDEDYHERGRVYMPQDELARFGLSDKDIANRNFSDDFRNFVVWQSERAQSLYDEAMKGVPLLEPHGRFSVRCAAALYSAILGKIAQQDHNVFAGRARTSTGEKIKLAFGARTG
jgi:phytoene synthase